MLSKKQAQAISRWENHQQGLMKYGQFLTTALTKQEIAAIADDRDDKFVNNVIPTGCAVEITPENPKCVFWMQVKGWYGEEKSYVYFTPDSEEKRNLFLKIAKKHLEPINEDVNYFNY